MKRKPYGSYGTIGPAPGFTWAEVRCTDGSLPLSPIMRRRYALQGRYLNQLRSVIAKAYKVPSGRVSITVNSWYRSPSYNQRIGGARWSQHVEGKATDIVVRVRRRQGDTVRLAPDFVALMAAKVPAFRNGGIGVYPSFTHVDHRRGKARWQG